MDHFEIWMIIRFTPHKINTLPKWMFSQKLFFKIIHVAKWLVRHSSTSPNQLRKPLPSVWFLFNAWKLISRNLEYTVISITGTVAVLESLPLKTATKVNTNSHTRLVKRQFWNYVKHTIIFDLKIKHEKAAVWTMFYTNRYLPRPRTKSNIPNTTVLFKKFEIIRTQF